MANACEGVVHINVRSEVSMYLWLNAFMCTSITPKLTSLKDNDQGLRLSRSNLWKTSELTERFKLGLDAIQAGTGKGCLVVAVYSSNVRFVDQPSRACT